MPGRPQITRAGTIPAGGTAAASITSACGSGSPAAPQLSAKAWSRSATAGPSTATPVSRHGSAFSDPHQRSAMQSPDTKPMRWCGDELAVVAPDPERGGQARRVEGADVDSSAAQARPERVQRSARGAEPVVQDADPHAGLSPLDQRLRERPPGLVVRDDEVLEVDRGLGRADRLEPGGVVLPRVAQEPQSVAVSQLAVCDAGECPVEPILVPSALPLARKPGKLGRGSVHAGITRSIAISGHSVAMCSRSCRGVCPAK
jgi:hypothetical protein